MKQKFLRILPALAVATVMVFGVSAAACSALDDKPLEGETYVDFTQGESDLFVASNGWTNGYPFNSQWSSEHATYNEDGLKLTIGNNPNGSAETYTEYFGGEVKSQASFGYGDYTVCMKPSKLSGTASAFFVYTGPSDLDENGNPNPWDEIDIEFTALDTTRVQFNYFVDGVGEHEKWYDLGFDAAEEFHEYGFRWTEDYIVWFVDGKPVYKVYADADNPMPSTESHIIMNCWRGDKEELEGWMGEFVEPNGEGAQYKYVKTSATPIMPEPEDTPVTPDEVYEGDWSKVDPVAVNFVSSNGKHQITADGTSYNVVYNGIDNTTDAYCNISGDITTAAEGKNWAHFTLKNNAADGSTPVIRVDVIGTNAAGETGKVLNTSANMNGTAVRTDLEWGGSFFENIAAGEDYECEISYEGVATQLLIMIDSTRASDSTLYSGNVTISDIKFAAQGDVVTPVEKPSLKINDQTVQITGTLAPSGPYNAVVGENNTLNVTYENMTGGAYSNVGFGGIASVFENNNTFTITVKNNGENSVLVRVDIIGSASAPTGAADGFETNVTNVSSTCVGGSNSYTDKDYGGSFVTLAAGETATLTIVYDGNGPRGAIQCAQVYFDSTTYQDTNVYSGNLTVSGMAVSYDPDAVIPDPTPDPDPEPTPDPTPDPDPEPTPDPEPVENVLTVNNQAVGVGGNLVANDGPYTAVVGENNTLNVTYQSVSDTSYQNVGLTGLVDVLKANNTLTLKVTNNGTATVNLRINMFCAKVGNNDTCNISATQDGAAVRTDTEWGGSFFTIEAGDTVTIVLVYDNSRISEVSTIQFMIDSHMGGGNQYSGDVTFSEMALSTTELPEEPDKDEGTELTFNSTETYTVSTSGTPAEEVTVTYTDMKGGTYANIAASDAKELAAGKDTFTITITNNGTTPVTVRVDLIGEKYAPTAQSSTDVTNVSSTCVGGKDSYTDVNYGGTFVTLEAGESATLTIVYDGEGARGAVQRVQIYFDSSVYQDTNTYSGNVTISGFAFSSSEEN